MHPPCLPFRLWNHDGYLDDDGMVRIQKRKIFLDDGSGIDTYMADLTCKRTRFVEAGEKTAFEFLQER